MPLGNPQSIVRQIILLLSLLHNLLLMISRRHWFLGSAFAIAVFSAAINPSSALKIPCLVLLSSLLLLPITNLIACCFDGRVRGGIKGAMILLSLILFALLMPQVDTNTALFTSPLKQLQHERA